MGWYYRICKRYTEYPELKKICNHTTKEHNTPDSKGILSSTHNCFRKTGRMKRNYFYCLVEFFPSIPSGKNFNYRSAAWTASKIAPTGDSKKEVIKTLKMMLSDAINYPVLNDLKKPYRELEL